MLLNGIKRIGILNELFKLFELFFELFKVVLSAFV